MDHSFVARVLRHETKRGRYGKLLEIFRQYEVGAEQSNTKRDFRSGQRFRPQRAWNVGETLAQRTAAAPAILPASSGLLALYWYSHWADFVGVLASADRRILHPHAAFLKKMLQCTEETAIVSRFDELDLGSSHPAMSGSATPADLAVLGITPTPTADQLHVEVLELNLRALALATWNCPLGLRAEIERAGREWLALDARAALALVTGRPAPLHRAYAFATANILPRRKERFIIAELLEWIRVVATPEDPRSRAILVDGEAVLDEATIQELDHMFDQQYPSSVLLRCSRGGFRRRI